MLDLEYVQLNVPKILGLFNKVSITVKLCLGSLTISCSTRSGSDCGNTSLQPGIPRFKIPAESRLLDEGDFFLYAAGGFWSCTFI